MIEPTESESLAELDAFCDALIAVRAEVDKVASGEWDAANPATVAASSSAAAHQGLLSPLPPDSPRVGRSPRWCSSGGPAYSKPYSYACGGWQAQTR